MIHVHVRNRGSETTMSLETSTEQQMLRDSAVRWVAGDATQRDAAARWQQMADFGWLGITVPEAQGGLGQGLIDACVLAEALGTGPVVDPWLPVVIQAAGLLAASGSTAARDEWLAAIARGDKQLVPAVLERGTDWRSARLATGAQLHGEGWVLDGRKDLVAGGARADAFLVGARLHGSDEVGLFIVPRQTAGLTVTPLESVDGAGACRLVLEGVKLEAGARLSGAGWAQFERSCDDALVVCCAESVGAMDVLLRTTAEYLKTRVQFGRALSVNQALRHRMADLSIACEEARSMTLSAIHALSDPQLSASLRARKAAGARAKVGLLARRVCEEAIQLHGGMGVTEELSVGLFLKRQLALDAMFGPAEWHLRRHAALRPLAA
jgi:alkylation response protein AidB-like acyl-CoA dehydrogenase